MYIGDTELEQQFMFIEERMLVRSDKFFSLCLKLNTT